MALLLITRLQHTHVCGLYTHMWAQSVGLASMHVHGFSRGVCTMMHWYLDMTCFITF